MLILLNIKQPKPLLMTVSEQIKNENLEKGAKVIAQTKRSGKNNLTGFTETEHLTRLSLKISAYCVKKLPKIQFKFCQVEGWDGKEGRGKNFECNGQAQAMKVVTNLST